MSRSLVALARSIVGRAFRLIRPKGQGPGEFSHPVRFQVLPGDTIVVWDRMFRPVSYFDPAGNLLRHRRIDFGAMVATLATDEILKESVGVPLLDGSFIVEVERLDWEPPSEGVYQPPVRVRGTQGMD